MFVNGPKTYQFKEKDSKLNAYILCLGNIWKWFVYTCLLNDRHVYYFSVDYDSINFYDILDFHQYLKKKQDIR